MDMWISVPMLLGLIFSYFAGVIGFYVLDGWFDFGCVETCNDGSTTDWTSLVSFIWPIAMWVVIACALKAKVKNIKKRRLERGPKQNKVRIPSYKVNDLDLEEAEAEVEKILRRTV